MLFFVNFFTLVSVGKILLHLCPHNKALWCLRIRTALGVFMTVYVRTSEGQDAAYNPDSALPRKLRSILKLIDGKTTLRMFEQNLESFGDVRSIFYSLGEAGLIKVQPDGGQHARVDMHVSDAEKQRLMKPSGSADWMPTRSPYAQHSLPGNPGLNGYLGAGTVPMSDAHFAVLDEQKASALKAVVDEMANFVLTHLPDQSFSLLKEIEEITSMELLAVTLGGYEQMVSHLGQTSDVHLKYIKSVIRGNL